MQLAHLPDRMLGKIVLTVGVVVAGARLVACRPAHTPSYYLADDLIASGLRAHEDEALRVHGFVATGSIQRLDGDDPVSRFMLVWHGIGIQVQVTGPLPDTFREQSEVIVIGRLVHHNGWRIDGTAVMAKCPSKYQGAPPAPREVTFK
jgi:cytochrome c-type biogenesis protein CcmE